MRSVVYAFLALVLAAPGALAARDGAADNPRSASDVRQLIADLGSDEYAVRRRAEDRLLRLGPEAFDELKHAENSSDLEIAERVRYIVQRMRVEWVHAEDTPDVRLALTRYGDLSDSEKRDRIRRLAELPDGVGLAALSRIARFEPAPLLARRAALVALRQDRGSDVLRGQAALCRQELGGSNRAPVRWIRLRLRELDAPRESVGDWANAVDAEAALLAEKSPETDFSIVRELVEHHLERCHDLKLQEETLSALTLSIDLIEEQLKRRRDPQFRQESSDALVALARWGVSFNEKDANVAALAWAMAWIIRHEQWELLAKVEKQFAQKIAKNRKLLYHLAAAQSKAGKEEESARLAERAFELKANDDDQRVNLAETIAELGFVDWAEREYRRAIDSLPKIDKRSMEARSDLAMWLHDREDCGAAAKLMGEFCDALEADRAGRQRLVRELGDGASGEEILAGFAARRKYYLACDDEKHADYDKQRQRLEEAARLYNKDPDILIAMYHAKGSDEGFRRKTIELIRSATAYQQQLIDEYSEVPTLYNQWAWLVANTEGDQAKAVAYSRRSLELAPDEPSYLDTLGRCYFAVGDLENAVKYQSQAVKLAPQYQVMKRQLKQFEDALAAKAK